MRTPGFFSHFGFDSLRDLPDIEKLKDAGLLEEESSADRSASENLIDGSAAFPSDLARAESVGLGKD